MNKQYKNSIELNQPIEGVEQQEFINRQPFDKSSFLPKTVVYKNIDEDFKRWTEEKLIITSKDGKEFPTMSLFSNQRFSEYTQSWKYTDSNNNLLLNFKTISRENNPQNGKIQNGYWNIPQQNKFYTIKKQIVTDDNGTESFLIMKMKQPTACDLNYKLSIFTTQYESINEFNEKILKLFNARQQYLQPNGYYMPMTLESINDESSYNIDDRQFYGQTYNIKTLGFILTDDDFKIEEVPLKQGVNIPMINTVKSIPEVEIEDCEDDTQTRLTIYVPNKCTQTNTSFKMDCDVQFNNIELINLFNNYKIYVNGEKIDRTLPFILHENDLVKINFNKQIKTDESKIILIGKNI